MPNNSKLLQDRAKHLPGGPN